MFQKTTLVGNLGGDPELRYTPQGDAVTSFSLATNRRWTGRDGQPGEETTWWRVSVWGKQAESCNKYLSKGKQVLIEGTLTPDKQTGGPRIWTDNSGNHRASYELRAITVQFLGGKGEQNDGERRSLNEVADWEPVSEEEIPF